MKNKPIYEYKDNMPEWEIITMSNLSKKLGQDFFQNLKNKGFILKGFGLDNGTDVITFIRNDSDILRIELTENADEEIIEMYKEDE